MVPPRRRSPRLVPEDPDWSTLPEELLECIGKMLPSRREAVKFRSICPAWRAALPFAKYIAPVLMLPFDPDSPADTVTFYTAADGGETTFRKNLPSLRSKRLCGSSRGWLALVDEAASVALLNPLTGAKVELPPADERVVAASFRHMMMSNGSEWVFLPPVGTIQWGLLRPIGSEWCPVGVQETIVRLDELKKSAIHQIVLSSSSPGSGDCVAMAALADSGTVAFCRVGVDRAWTLLHTHSILPLSTVNSVLHFRGSTFLAIYDGRSVGPGAISICDVAGAAPTATLLGAPELTTIARSYLEVNGELYRVDATVVQGSGSTNLSSRVYKCNVLAVKPRWTRVKKTQSLTFFMSSNFTVGYGGAASVAGFKRNSVYCAKHDPYRDQVELEIIDIAKGTSEFQHSHRKIQGNSGALCWIQPNHWAQKEGILMNKMVKHHKRRSSQAEDAARVMDADHRCLLWIFKLIFCMIYASIFLWTTLSSLL